jgi:hypothetical protein
VLRLQRVAVGDRGRAFGAQRAQRRALPDIRRLLALSGLRNRRPARTYSKVVDAREAGVAV